MIVPGLALGIVVIVLAWLMFRRRVATPTRGPQDYPASGDDQAATPAARHDTTLHQLRDLRDALKPAEHTRIERRRVGGAGPYVGPERRRAATRSLPRQRPDELPE